MGTWKGYSPGPWKAQASNVFAADGLRVAMVDGAYGSEIEANTHLIASAPDLLETLEWTLERLNTLTTDAYSKGGDRAIRERLQETINKARGQG